MNKNCVYYCEGEDDLKLIDALKVPPSRILPGKSRKLNVIQSLIPKSILVSIKPGSNVVLVFDTDVTINLEVVKKNIDNIKRYCRDVNIIYTGKKTGGRDCKMHGYEICSRTYQK